MPLIGAEALAVRPLALRGLGHEASYRGGVSASISEFDELSTNKHFPLERTFNEE